ncbi:hypothetical protein, partial [Paenilisteria newyorkensis]
IEVLKKHTTLFKNHNKAESGGAEHDATLDKKMPHNKPRPAHRTKKILRYCFKNKSYFASNGHFKERMLTAFALILWA